MELCIRTNSIEVTDELRELIAKRLQFALDTFKGRAASVSVYLDDVNGPRGGIDKTCEITAVIQGLGQIHVGGSGRTIEAALTRTARRLKYCVSESLRLAQKPANQSIRLMSTAA